MCKVLPDVLPYLYEQILQYMEMRLRQTNLANLDAFFTDLRRIWLIRVAIAPFFMQSLPLWVAIAPFFMQSLPLWVAIAPFFMQSLPLWVAIAPFFMQSLPLWVAI